MSYGTLQNDKSQRAAIQALLNGTAPLPPDALFPGSVARSVVGKLGELPSVTDLGADPTGVADSAAAFTTAAASGKKYRVPKGTYRLASSVSLPSDACLIGDNRATVTIQPDIDVDAFTIDLVAAGASMRDICVRDMSVIVRSTAFKAGRMNCAGMKVGAAAFWIKDDHAQNGTRDPRWVFQLELSNLDIVGSQTEGNRVGACGIFVDGALLYSTRIRDILQYYPCHGLSRSVWGVKIITAANADPDTDTITLAGHGFSNNDQIAFVMDDWTQAFSIGLSPRARYYAINVSTDTFQVSATSGGSALDISGAAPADFGVAEVFPGVTKTDRCELVQINNWKVSNPPDDGMSIFMVHNAVRWDFLGSVETYPSKTSLGILNWPYATNSAASSACRGAIYNEGPTAGGGTLRKFNVIEGRGHDLWLAHGPVELNAYRSRITGALHERKTGLASGCRQTLINGSSNFVENTGATGNWNVTDAEAFIVDRGVSNRVSNTGIYPPYWDGVRHSALADGIEEAFGIVPVLRGLDYPLEHYFIPGLRCGQVSATTTDVSYVYDSAARTKTIFRQNRSNGDANFLLKAPSGRDWVPTVNLPNGYYLFRFRVRTSNNSSATGVEFRLRYGADGATGSFTNIITQSSLTFPNTYAIYEYMVNLSSLTSSNWPLCLTFVGADGNDWLLDWAALIPAAAMQWQDRGSAAPTVGQWPQGWLRWNTAPAAAGAPGWVCTAAGTPGTWNAMAAVAA